MTNPSYSELKYPTRQQMREEIDNLRAHLSEALADADALRTMRLDESAAGLKAQLSEARKECARIAADLARAQEALRKHACPNDGSTDTVCWPNNSGCTARAAGQVIE